MYIQGIPATGVLSKMKLSNVDTELIVTFMDVIGHESDDFGTPKNAGTTLGLGVTPDMARKVSVPLVKLHWSTVDPDKLSKSLWASYDKDMKSDDLFFQATDIDELEQLFGAAKTTVKVSGGGGGGGGGRRSSDNNDIDNNDPNKMYVIDSKRSQNIIIGLNPFKTVASTSAIIDAILSLDPLNGLLSADRLCTFASILPTENEIKKLSICIQTKNPAELFLKMLIPHCPTITRRLETFIICEQFEEHIIGAQEKAGLVIGTATDVSIL